MKKVLLLLSVLVGVAFGASAQCNPDTTHFTSGHYLYPSSLPCVQRGIAYSHTQTVKVPDTLSYTIPVINANVAGIVDSIRIDSIAGEPAGITSASSPALGTWLQHNSYACATFSGTTSAPVGAYPLTISGRACGHFTYSGFAFDTCINYTFTRSYPDTITVCYPAGVSELTAGVDMNIYPNPNQGNFTVTISSSSRINGTMAVVDQLGRTISTQSLDVTGTKQIALNLGNVSAGVYLLVINSESGRSVKQFSIK